MTEGIPSPTRVRQTTLEGVLQLCSLTKALGYFSSDIITPLRVGPDSRGRCTGQGRCINKFGGTVRDSLAECSKSTGLPGRMKKEGNKYTPV